MTDTDRRTFVTGSAPPRSPTPAEEPDAREVVALIRAAGAGSRRDRPCPGICTVRHPGAGGHRPVTARIEAG